MTAPLPDFRLTVSKICNAFPIWNAVRSELN